MNSPTKRTVPIAGISIPCTSVQTFATSALVAAGVREDVAIATAEGLIWASLRGIDSHGIRLLQHYLTGVEGGRINLQPDFHFEQTSAATGVLDADHGFGHAAGMEAMKRAIALARESGAGHVVVCNSSHCGALGYFAEEACRHDMIGTAMTHATARLRSHNGRRAFFGNNPFCWAAPMLGEDPFCYDGAQSAITFNEVKRHQEEGLTLPPGLVADAQGRETTDPATADQLLPIGDYKGFGLAMMVDVFCALLSGMPAGPDISRMFDDPMHRRRELGHYFGALRIDVFQPVENFKAGLTSLAARVRAEPTRSSDVPVMVPGDPEKVFAADRRKSGVPLSGHDRKSLLYIAERLGVTPPAELLERHDEVSNASLE